MDRVAWTSPIDVLKLNFDIALFDSLEEEVLVVLLDWNGNVIRRFSGPLESSDANEIGVFALLVGCRELRTMGGYNFILEGNSFSAIQWGSGKSSYPWRLAD